MVRRYVRPAVLAAMLAASLSVSSASAQDAQPQQRRPDQGLFQGGEQGTEHGDVLLLSGAAFESYDDNIAAGQASGSPTFDQRFQSSGFYSGGDAALFYGKRSERVRVGANAGAAIQYYPRLADLTQTSYHAGIDLSAVRGRRTYQAMQAASWLPFFVLGTAPLAAAAPPLFPTAPNPDTVFVPPLAGTQDVAVFSQPLTSYQTGLGFTQAVGRRFSLGLNYGLNMSDLSEGLADLTNQSARGTLSLQVSRNASLRSGYGYQDAVFDTVSEGTKRSRTHSIDVGFQYLRALSATRSIGVSGGSGASILQRDEDTHPELAGKKYYSAIGSAGFTYMFHRTWSANAEYRRSLQLLEGVSQPFYTDDVGANLGGRFSRRVDFLGGVRYSQGVIAFDSVSRDHDTRSGSIRLRYALSGQLALLGEYAFYGYTFSRQVDLPEGISRKLDRQVIRAGLTFGLPLLRRSRK